MLCIAVDGKVYTWWSPITGPCMRITYTRRSCNIGDCML